MNLPNVLDSFLVKGERSLIERSATAYPWGDITLPVWEIPLQGGCKSSLFQIGENESIKISWSIRLGSHNLLDPYWSVLRVQSQDLFARVLQDPSRASLSPLRANSIHDQFVVLLEHLAFFYAEEVREVGLKVITYDRLESFLYVYHRGGVSATGLWLERFMRFIEKEIEALGRGRSRSEHSYFKDEALAAKNYIPLCCTVSEDVRPAIDRYDNKRIAAARRWLSENGWFDRDGRILLSRVADAIGVNKSRMCRSYKRFEYSLRKLGACVDYSAIDAARAEHREFTGTRCNLYSDAKQKPMAPSSQHQMYGAVRGVVRALPKIFDESARFSPPISLDGLLPELRGGAGEGRTPTLPIDLALYAYDRLISYATTMPSKLCAHTKRILEKVGPDIHKPNLPKQLTRGQDVLPVLSFSLGENCLSLNGGIPKLGLANLRRTRSRDGTSGVARKVREQGMSLLDAFTLNGTVLAAVIGALCMRRRREICEIKSDALVVLGERTYIRVNLAKIGLDGTQATALRPIPRFLFEALLMYRKHGLLLQAILNSEDCRPFPYLFWHVAWTRKSIVRLSPETMSRYLSFFCDLIELPVDEKCRRWYIRFHELRRFAALSFFRTAGMENSLPALSWMLGHRDVHRTWRYIREELTGEELTKAEVAMAHAALLNKQELGAAKGVTELTEVVFRYFGARSLTLIDPDDLDDYLTYLKQEGGFTVTPHTVPGTEGREHVIVVHVRKEGA